MNSKALLLPLLGSLAACGSGSMPGIAPLPQAVRVEGEGQLVARGDGTYRKYLCDQRLPIRCLAVAATDANGYYLAPAASGYGPADLMSAYNFDNSVDPKATIGVLIAGAYANAESDLAAYRKQFNLPECSKANGCLKIVNAKGQDAPLPASPLGMWPMEGALDLAMVSAVCPKCKIILALAEMNVDSLYGGELALAKLGATVINNSFAGAQDKNDSSEHDADEQYMKPVAALGVPIFAGSGDHGYHDMNGGMKPGGPLYPSTSAYVLAVGGTNLQKDGSARGWSESAWDRAGTSCSYSVPKPAYQSAATGCTFRATTDLSAVAAESPGVAYVYNGQLQTVGGTSVASPIVASLFALTGHVFATQRFPYDHPEIFNDVTSGGNGGCQGALCNAGAGWDGPTGLGTPDGKKLAALAKESPPDFAGAPDLAGAPSDLLGGGASDAAVPLDLGAGGVGPGGSGGQGVVLGQGGVSGGGGHGGRPSETSPSGGCSMGGAAATPWLFLLALLVPLGRGLSGRATRRAARR